MNTSTALSTVEIFNIPFGLVNAIKVSMNDIKVKRHKGVYMRILMLTPITLFFIVRSLINNLNSGDSRGLFIVLLVAFAILCTAFLVNAIFQVLKKDAAMVINDLGIVDNLNFQKIGLIPWGNISACRIEKFTGTPHLVLALRDNDEILSKLEGVKKKLIEVKVRDLGTPFAVNTKLLDADVNELVNVIRSKMPATHTSQTP